MVNVIVQPASQFRPVVLRGNWACRRRHSLRSFRRVQTWPGLSLRDTGVIQGYIKIGSVGAQNCRAVLISEETGTVIDDYVITDGSYVFARLMPGKYAVAIIDTAGEWRGKVIHTVVPAP